MATLMTHKHTHTHNLCMHTHSHRCINKQTGAYTWHTSVCVCVCIVCVLLSLWLSSFAFAIVFVSIFLCLLLPLLLLTRNDFANCQLLFMCRTLLNEFKRGKLPANQPSRLPTTNPMPPARQTPNNTLAHTHTHTYTHCGTVPAAIEPSNCLALLSILAKPIKGPSDGIFLLGYKLKIS